MKNKAGMIGIIITIIILIVVVIISNISTGNLWAMESAVGKLFMPIQNGIIYLKRVKPFGKKEMDINSFVNGINKEEYLNKVVD